MPFFFVLDWVHFALLSLPTWWRGVALTPRRSSEGERRAEATATPCVFPVMLLCEHQAGLVASLSQECRGIAFWWMMKKGLLWFLIRLLFHGTQILGFWEGNVDFIPLKPKLCSQERFCARSKCTAHRSDIPEEACPQCPICASFPQGLNFGFWIPPQVCFQLVKQWGHEGRAGLGLASSPHPSHHGRVFPSQTDPVLGGIGAPPPVLPARANHRWSSWVSVSETRLGRLRLPVVGKETLRVTQRFRRTDRPDALTLTLVSTDSPFAPAFPRGCLVTDVSSFSE